MPLKTRLLSYQTDNTIFERQRKKCCG